MYKKIIQSLFLIALTVIAGLYALSEFGVLDKEIFQNKFMALMPVLFLGFLVFRGIKEKKERKLPIDENAVLNGLAQTQQDELHNDFTKVGMGESKSNQKNLPKYQPIYPHEENKMYDELDAKLSQFGVKIDKDNK